MITISSTAFLEVLSDSDIQEFRLEGDDFRLEVRRNLPAVAVAAAPVAAVAAAPAAPMQVSHEVSAPSTPPSCCAGLTLRSGGCDGPHGGHLLPGSRPGEAPFVEVGTRIGVGQTVCILEAMKLERA